MRCHLKNAAFIQSSQEFAFDNHLLKLGQARTVVHVEEQRNPRVRGVDVLTARPRTARGDEPYFLVRDDDGFRDSNHGSNLPWLAFRRKGHIVIDTPRTSYTIRAIKP